MSISPNKRRYTVSLTPSVVDRYHSLAKSAGIPTTVSNLCEDALKQTSELLQTLKDKGSFNIEDLRKIMGQQMELLADDERKITDERKKRSDS